MLAHSQSLAYITGQTPAQAARLPAALPAGGPVTLGPGQPRLVVFYATWLSEITNLSDELTSLNSYVQAARARHLPGLTAVDEAVTEPTSTAARGYLQGLKQPLSYPVALDTTGRVADGYGVQDQPWFVLTSAAGKILWSHDGWLSPAALEAAVAKHAA